MPVRKAGCVCVCVSVLLCSVISYGVPIRKAKMGLCLIRPLPFILSPSLPLLCLYTHGGDQAWRQWSVSSYTLRRLFVEKAGGAHTMVKVMFNVPFRINSSIWTHKPRPRYNKATCRWKCCLRRRVKALWMVWCLINHSAGLYLYLYTDCET